MTVKDAKLADLKTRARSVSTNAYAPYSQFHVGAVVADDQGSLFSACNVENASFGLTQCAERNAIAAAIAAGSRNLGPILIYTPGSQVHAPCGACRQFISELLNPEAMIISCCDSDEIQQWRVSDLLPYPFEKQVLLKD